jgi:DNA mismatch endonuclease (patch repair protein)
MAHLAGRLWRYRSRVAIAVPPPPGPSARSENMRSNRRRDTGPERRVRSLLHRRGLRYRVDLPIHAGCRGPVRPDIVFSREKLAVFVDGCFWHGCPDHGHVPASNAAYWEPKLARNVQRDHEHDQALEAAGWGVLRVWEHTPSEEAARLIQTRLEERRALLLSD